MAEVINVLLIVHKAALTNMIRVPDGEVDVAIRNICRKKCV